MRMGVLDIGSNTGHLLVVDAYRGGPPVPAHTFKETLRLAEHLDGSGGVTNEGVARLVKYVREARQAAEEQGCSTVLAFATSAVRDAVNSDEELANGNRLIVVQGIDRSLAGGVREIFITHGGRCLRHNGRFTVAILVP